MAAQSKRIGESKIISARAEVTTLTLTPLNHLETTPLTCVSKQQVESAKLMRQAADILSSAPAMQIRYLEAMQSMAKSANSKVIFLPAANQTMPGTAAFNAAMNNAEPLDAAGAGSGSSIRNDDTFSDFAGQNHGFQQAVNARVIENI